ncbi:MAG TPA: SDR family NAD(P)-dependent oxidoreductase [Actinomycetota bacterium]|nr:SDR family NAD(P)-dependent oxidoreductase [Actinomycetota bacterium]
MSKTAVITGASAGIGAATAVRLAHEGFDVVLGARRLERLEEVARASGGRGLALDVADAESVRSFCAQVERVDVLVNNAGMATGMTPLSELSDEAAARMWEVNVMGVLRMTRELLPKIEASGEGHVVNVGSTAGMETYRGGGGYTASKHALRALTDTLRLELLGKPVRVTEVAPGLVETEFSLVRFGGDPEKAKLPYQGIEPLTADDIADCIAWAVTRPPHVDIDRIVVRPVAQARSTEVARKTT